MRERRTRLFGALIALTMLSACGGPGGKGKPTPTPTTTAGVGAFTTLDLGLPSQAMKAPVTGRVPGDKTLHVGVTLKVSDATWQRFGHGKSPLQGADDVGKKLGISEATIAKIQSYLASAHIQAKASKTRTSLTFDVKAGVIGKLLQTSFVTHKLKGRSFFTPDPAHPPKIPTRIAPYLLAVTGLESYTLAPRKRLSAPRALPAARAGGCIRFPQRIATPQKVAAAYGYNRLWAQGWHGENMTVNLVEMDGYDQRDVTNYIACTGSRISLGKVDLGAASPRPGGEATLDIQMLAGLAPRTRVVDYEEDPALLATGNGADSWTAFNNALQRIIDDNSGNNRPNGSAVSISLGGPEMFMSRATMQAIDQSLRILTQAEHMTVFVASGDCGAYADRVYGPLDVSFPASSTWAVAVGGTRMSFSPAGARTQETVWSDRSSLAGCQNQWGSGGGLSRVYPRPAYQRGPGVANQFSNGAREVPDVAAAAIELPVYFQGRWLSVGGTSAATPIWAAGMALVNQGLIARRRYFCFGPDTFYHVAAVGGATPPYYDVVSGNNLHYPATRGYDMSTGLGTPNASNIFTVLSTSPE